MTFDNKYFLGTVGWLPERGTYGVSLSFLPQERSVELGENIISHSFFVFIWCGWRRWPVISFRRDSRY